MKRILIIIPTYNEKENIQRLIPAVLQQDERIHVLILDDSSPDGTGILVREWMEKENRLHLIEREGKLGLATAYITGFQYGIRENYDYIFEMDADFSHDPVYLPEMIAKLEQGYDIVTGSRYVHGVSVANWPLKRLLLSKLGGWYANLILHIPATDVTAGFVGYRKQTLQSMDLDAISSKGFCFQIEMKYRAYRKGCKFVDVPIIFYERQIGESKISRSVVFEALWKVWKLKFFVR